jgi:hypothetical protein
MDCFGRTKSALTIALHKGLYLPIIMDRDRGPQSALIIALLLPCIEATFGHYNGPL